MENTVSKKNEVTTGAGPAPIGTAAPKDKVKSLPVTGKFSINDKGYLVAILDNPFPEEPLGTLTLDFENPNKQDRWGNKDDDRRGARNEGAFRFCTKKAGEDVAFTGECVYNRMTDKKGTHSDFIAIHINSPFPGADINGGNPVRVFFKQGATQGEFDIAATSRLKLTPVKELKERR